MTTSLLLAAVPAAALGQEVSPIDSAIPQLADAGSIQSSRQICDWSGGTLDGRSCSLPSELLVDSMLVEAFGPEVEIMSVKAAGGPVVLSGTAPSASVAIERVTFAPQIPIEGGAAKWLNGRQKSKDKTIAKSRQTKWNKLDSVGLVSLHLAEPINLRKLSKGGVVLASLEDGERTVEAGFVDRKPTFSSADGRKTDGMVLFGNERIDFLLPNGLSGPFTVNLVVLDKRGRISGHNVTGPGGSDARIPLERYPAVLQCGSIIADVDPSSTTDGNTFDLDGLTISFESPLIPEDIGDAQPTFDVKLTPSGARAAQQLDDLMVQITPPPSEVRRAIALQIDMSTEGFAGATGYHFGELPYTVADLSTTWTPEDGPADYDPELAALLLKEAGWTDVDGDGTLEIELGDVAQELNRLAGGITSSPVHWGWDGCGKDSHWTSVQDACRQQIEGDLRESLAEILGEAPEMLSAVPGSFAEGFTGCSIFGEQDAFVGTWLLEQDYGKGSTYDPAVLEPFVQQLDCDVSADASPGAGLRQVGSCPAPGMEIFYDNSRGFGSYFAFNGQDLDIDHIATAIVPLIADPDLDGDGISDRFDPDVDGDGLANDVDQDDDNDMVLDPQDWAPTNPDEYVSPNTFADQLESLGVN